MFTRKLCYSAGKYLLIGVTFVNVYVLISNNNSGGNSLTSPGEAHQRFKSTGVRDDDKIDWHDYKFMFYEQSRTGLGENGAPFNLTDPKEIADNKLGYDLEGFYTVVSDKISPNRSVPDARLDVCKTRKYLRHLPSTSVIVIFVDEPWSLLLRCVHSIYNRTPRSILKEIVLVNDHSNNVTLGPRIEQYARENFGDKVKYFQNAERKGLIVTRMEGARHATGDVIVFLDSHMEVNVNWLPPLIEPIALDCKVATVPIIDSFSPFTLEYQRLGQGSRGSFDWTLTYQWLGLTTEYQKKPGDNYQLSAMTGGAYAINREYFFELGGYDEGLMVWNGENYELSFKLHLCGGNLMQIPCSHVAHTTKHRTPYRNEKYGIDYSARNLKRVAEVWMDEYKEALYNTEPKRYSLDAGDLTKAFELKKRLNCKPFKYYLDVIAPDLADRFPPFPTNFATGAISSEADSSLCVTYVGPEPIDPLQLRPCSANQTNPSREQNFALTWFRTIKYQKNDSPDGKLCVDMANVNMYGCHFNFGNQLWKYDWESHQLMNTIKNVCISADVSTKQLTMKPCVVTDIHQKFKWAQQDLKALKNWERQGRRVRFITN